MKKLKRLWDSTSKKLRVVLNLCVIGLLIFTLYVLISAPPFTTEIQYRRAEKANLIGPAEILGMVERNFSNYDRFLLAQDEEGVIIYADSTANREEPELIYREKTGDITVLAAPDHTPYNKQDQDRRMTIFLFDSFPEAVRAELDITLSADYNGEHFEKTYSLKSTRDNIGYFHFTLLVFNRNGLGAEGYAMQIFTLLSGYVGRNFIEYSIPATVRLYDAQDKLICEETVHIRSVEAQAHADRGDPLSDTN